MDGLYWKTLLIWMIGGKTHFFRFNIQMIPTSRRPCVTTSVPTDGTFQRCSNPNTGQTSPGFLAALEAGNVHGSQKLPPKKLFHMNLEHVSKMYIQIICCNGFNVSRKPMKFSSASRIPSQTKTKTTSNMFQVGPFSNRCPFKGLSNSKNPKPLLVFPRVWNVEWKVTRMVLKETRSFSFRDHFPRKPDDGS